MILTFNIIVFFYCTMYLPYQFVTQMLKIKIFFEYFSSPCSCIFIQCFSSLKFICLFFFVFRSTRRNCKTKKRKRRGKKNEGRRRRGSRAKRNQQEVLMIVLLHPHPRHQTPHQMRRKIKKQRKKERKD